jgi:hypothetical protein
LGLDLVLTVAGSIQHPVEHNPNSPSSYPFKRYQADIKEMQTNMKKEANMKPFNRKLDTTCIKHSLAKPYAPSNHTADATCLHHYRHQAWPTAKSGLQPLQCGMPDLNQKVAAPAPSQQV